MEGIRRGAQSDFGSRLQFLQLLRKRPNHILLEVNFVFEIFGGLLEELVRVAGIAMPAGKLAAAIGIDGVSERQFSLRIDLG